MNSHIRKTWRNILLLAVAAGVLAATSWLLPENTTDEARTFLLPAGMEIAAIRIQRGETEFRLQRANAGKQWEVFNEGQQQPAAEQKIRNLLDALRAPVSQSYPAGKFDLAEVRLDPPMASITVNDDIVLHLGSYTGIEQQRYLRHEQTVYLVSPLLGYYLEQPARFFVADASADAGAESPQD